MTYRINVSLLTILLIVPLLSQGRQPILLEVFTSASCPYCPDAEAIAQQLATQYPEIIWINHHIQDSMTSSFSKSFWEKNGYFTIPKAMVNRVKKNNSLLLGLSECEPIIITQRNQNALPFYTKVDGSYYIQNRNSVVINQSAISFPTTLDSTELYSIMFIVYDSLIGSGSGYDQLNGYNYRSGHPYFGRGDTIHFYPHRYVALRSSSLDPVLFAVNPVRGSVYYFDYAEYTIPKLTIDPDKISRLRAVVVVLRKVDDTMTVATCWSIPIFRSARNYSRSPSFPPTSIETLLLPPDTITIISIPKSFPRSSDPGVYISIDSATTLLPPGWLVSTSNYLPKENDTAKFLVHTNDKAGVATITYFVDGEDNDDTVALKEGPFSFQVASTATRCMVSIDYTAQTFAPIPDTLTSFYHEVLNASPLHEHYAILCNIPEPINQTNDRLLDALSKHASVIITHLRVSHIGEPPAIMSPSLTELLLAGKRILLHGTEGITAIERSINKAFFKNYFGASITGTAIELGSNSFIISPDTTIDLGKKLPLMILCNATGSIQLSQQLDNVIELDPTAPAIPFLYLNRTNKPVGFFHATDSTRAIWLSFRLEAISDSTQRAQVFHELLSWLLEKYSGIRRPRIEIRQTNAPNMLIFDTTVVGSTSEHTFLVRNSGDTTLIINGFDIDPSDATIFPIVSGDSVPIILEPADEHPVTIAFRPQRAQEYLSGYVIRSNAQNGDAFVALYGVGQQQLSTSERLSEVIVISPSPVTTDAYIRWTLTTTISPELTLIDTFGRILIHAIPEYGVQSFHLDATTLPSGVYRLMLRSGTELVSVPVVVIK